MYKLIWPKVDEAKVFEEIENFFGLSHDKVKRLYADYEEIVKEHNHALLGEMKTLNTLETFICFLMMKQYKPTALVEIGTLLGKSTRRILDIKNKMKLSTQVVCYDIVNKVKHFEPHEAELILKDITETVPEDIMEQWTDGLIYLDAHPYRITYNVIAEVLKTDKWPLIIHDCGEVLCNPKMTLSKDDPNITSLTGHWERYVLAEVFGIKNPLDPRLNYQETETHKMKIFSTLHGLCAIIPK